MTYLKTLIALTGLALLTACAGGVAITNNTTIIPPAAICTANPFTTGCTTTLAEQATFCRDDTKATDTKTRDCAATVIRVCTGDVFDTICPTAPTETEAEAFCRDTTKTPDGKATNCTPTVMRVCGENPYDAGLCYVGNTFNGQRQRIELTCENANDAERHALCPMAVATECTTNPFNAVCRLGTAGVGAYNTARLMAIADCGDATKRDTIANEVCAGATTQACGENPYNAGLCYDGTTYDSARERIRLTCDKGDSGRDALCPTAVATECMADPFLDVCRLGTAGAETGTYGLERAAQILATCAGENGEGFGNVFDPKCSDVEPYQTEKDRITNECESGGGNTETCPANVVMQVCIGNPYNTVLCFEQGGTDYSTQRMERLEACKGTNTLAGCAAAAATTCPANPFQAVLCFIEDTYTGTRASQTETCRGTPNGANCDSARALGCVITADVVTNVLFTDMLCNSHMDYHADRERICLTNKTAPACTLTVMRVCDANNFDPLCDESMTYQDLREAECTDPNDGRCDKTTLRICGADKFDTYCMGATAFIADQLSECADATATTEKCNGVFATALASCLQDPFTPGCDAEPTFTASKVAVRTSRFSFCAISGNETDDRCTGYRTCNTSATFAPLTCGADFQPVRMAFCMTTANAFDPLCIDNNLIDTPAQMAYCMVTSQAFDAGCVDNLKNAEAQLNFCKLTNSNPFANGCEIAEFKDARVAFCLRGTNAVDDQRCIDDDLEEGLVPPPDVCEEQTASTSCANFAALPTYPTLPEEKSPTAGDAFANGFLKVTLIAPTDGTPLLNPDGTENSTIDTTNFPATTRLVEVLTAGIPAPRFGRRGGRGSSDADGFVWFSIYKGATGEEFAQRSRHAAILPTTNLGAPLTEAPTTAVWPGHFYRSNNRIDAADFYVTFESLPSNQIGRIGFANKAKDGIGTGNERPLFARSATDLQIDMTFDANGVLSGTVIPTNFAPAQPATGLIGTEGAVAVSAGSGGFVGFTATNPFAGYVPPSVDACIADPNSCFVTYTDWVDATSPTSLQNQATSSFAIARDSFFLNTNFASNDIDTNLATAQFGGEALGGDTRDGFIVGFSNTNNRYFAGLSATTNLGLPLNVTTAGGTWNGSFQVYEDGPSTLVPSDFTLTVTYGGASEGKTGSLSATIANTDYSFVGEFNASGVIDGTVTHTDATNSTGELQGLIGTQGAVGIFFGNTGTQSFGGGFVACPYNATTNKCESSQ